MISYRDLSDLLQFSSDLGKIATHPERTPQPFLVAPTTAALFNTLGLDIIPVACMSLHDVVFAFDSSFLTSSATTLLQQLPALRTSHMSLTGVLPPLSVFGHADPTGEDELNKQLSGRRATATYGALTQSVAIWRKLLNNPSAFGDDNWRQQKVPAQMRAVVGSGPKTDDELIKAYLAAICPFQLQPSEFLGKGNDPALRSDIQGCSSFNPLLILSEKQTSELSKEDRNAQNQQNRRVVIFLFRPGIDIDTSLWPCPSATEPTAKCRKRFFGPPNTGDLRRKPDPSEPRLHIVTPNPEVDAPDDTFACRFYYRVSHLSPCEGKIIPVVRTVHVFLKLVYKDPDDAAGLHEFPPDFSVIVDDGSGAVVTVKTQKGGLIDFDFDRNRLKFTLRFEPGKGQYFANASKDTKGPGPERLLAEADVKDSITDHYRLFKVPAKWSISNTDWAVAAPNFSASFFQNMDDNSVTVGTAGAPVQMTLDPHWQYLKFSYFDRKLKKRLSILPIVLEGFETAKAADDPPTRSNWTTANGCQCLPWILRDKKKPDSDTLVRFKTDDHTFIESSNSADSRKLISGTEHNTPSADRLRFYDLPKLWKSTKYFGAIGDRQTVTDSSKLDVYEKLAVQTTSLSAPIEFSLDDLVLTDQNLQPVSWLPKQRAALFLNTFHSSGVLKSAANVIDIGLYNSDAGNNQNFLTKVPNFENTRNYIADYPDWVRLVVALGNMYDAFDKRTTEGKGDVVGARAAVRWKNAPPLLPVGSSSDSRFPSVETPFFSIRPFSSVSRKEAFDTVAPSDFITGRFDMALLRCCDFDDDVEVCAVVQYERHSFNFAPAAQPGSKPLLEPLKSDKTVQAVWSQDAVVNSIARWNGLDGVGDLRAVLTPQDDANKLRCTTVWFAQPVSTDVAHIRWSIFETFRAGTADADGTGSFEKDDNAGSASGSFTCAHEFGHVAALGDEYQEPINGLSYRKPGIFSYSPGSPFNLDRPSQMRGNREPRHRHFWICAEWLQSLKGVNFAFQVEAESDAADPAKLVFKLPQHPKAPKFNYLYYPLANVNNISVAKQGQSDLFVYPLGPDKYPTDILPGLVNDTSGTSPAAFDGIVIVLVKLKVTCHSNDGPTITSLLDRIEGGLDLLFNNMFEVTGTVTAPDPTGTVTFEHAYLHFTTRYIVPDFSDKAKKDTGIKTASEYTAKAAQIEATHGIHHSINIVKTGATAFSTEPKPHGRLNLLETDKFEAVVPGFYWQMLGLPNNSNTSFDAQAKALEPLIQLLIKDAKVKAYPR